MYGIFTYIWLIFMVNVHKYTIHGSYGIGSFQTTQKTKPVLDFITAFDIVKGGVHFLRAHLRGLFVGAIQMVFGILTEIVSCMDIVRLKGGKTETPTIAGYKVIWKPSILDI